MKIESIVKYNENAIKVLLSNKEWAVFYPFAKTIYTQTSPGVLKKTLSEFKKDVIKTNWNAEELSRLYIKNYGK